MDLRSLAHALQLPFIPRSPCLVVAHPDDETLGASTLLPVLGHAAFVFLTDGSPADGNDAARLGLTQTAYAACRRAERDAALSLGCCRPPATRELNLRDQTASLHLPALAQTLADHFEKTRCDLVLTHAYEGGHPDHDAAAFSVHAAVRLLTRRAPIIIEMALYHAAAGAFTSNSFIHAAGALTVHLTAGEQARKRRLLACYNSQAGTLALFSQVQEQFRLAPQHDFTRPPHRGPLHYESQPWGMTGPRFTSLARAALTELGFEGDNPASVAQAEAAC
ncbi:MAG TPA: PIG-L family deacetylase [Phycisphaerales bacterium]|nr:PIG-L family deacetylase [Phycisphaerales bacterium]